MKQLVLFQMPKAQSLHITGKAIFGKQSKLSSSITTNYDFSDFFPPCDMDESQADWGDIYDEYEDFDVCSQDWH